MPAGSTYTPIATTTLGSQAPTVTFSSIPSTYTDLILIYNTSSTTGFGNGLRFNGDSGTNYSMTQIYGTGSTAASNRLTNNNYAYNGEGSTTLFQTHIVHIQNYSNTTTNKTHLWRMSDANQQVQQGVGLWRSTAAINEIQVRVDTAGNFNIGSTFTLYGIASA